MLILINNKFVTVKNAKISILSEAFMYGYGVFETLSTYNKIPFKTKEHIERLFNSAKIIGLKINYSKDDIIKMLNKITKKSAHKDQRLKIIAIKEGIIVISTKLIVDQKIYKGVKCKTVQMKRTIPEAKTLAYLDSYISHEKAVNKGFFEAILIDENKEVYEGAYSNIFWFEGNTLCTRKDKVLKGITRDTIIKFFPYKIKYKNINLDELLKKKEIFLTQTTTEIVPIIKINTKKIGSGKPGEKTLKLIDLFRNNH